MKKTYISPNIKIRYINGSSIMAQTSTSGSITIDNSSTTTPGGSITDDDGTGGHEVDSKRNIWFSDDEEN